MKRLIALCALAAVVAGCGHTAAGPLRVARPGARVGGTLVVGITAPGTIDPSAVYEPEGDLVVSTMCDPLIPLDPVTGLQRGGLVSSWQMSGSTITLLLAKGARFSDGRKVTADDVAATLARVASVDEASFDAPQLENIKGYDTVHGDKETSSTQKRTQLSGVQVLSSSSIQVALTSEDPDYVRLFSAPFLSPVPKQVAASKGDAFAADPVCAGPYRLDRPYHPGDAEIDLSRTPGYHGTDHGYTRNGAGYVDHIRFRIYPSAAAAAADYQAGNLDVVGVDEPSVATTPDLVSAPSGSIEYIGLPDGSQGSPFANPAVRVALSQALDRTALIAAAFHGARQPATGFVPPTLGAAFVPNACRAATPGAGDVGAARATLAHAGVRLQGTTVKLYFNDEFDHRQLAAAVAAQWRSAFGLTVTLVPMPWDQYVAAATSASGLDGAFRESWVAPYVSADQYIWPLFESSGIGADNWARFTNGQLDLFLERSARRATADGDREADYHHAEQTLCQQMPMIPIAFGSAHWLVRQPAIATATGAWTEVATGQPNLREVYRR